MAAFSEPHTGLVMIRVDDWGDGDLARCGLGFRLDPGDASGVRVFDSSFP